MHSVACSAVSGHMECSFVGTGDTPEAAKDALKAHAMEAHPELVEGKSEEEMMAMEQKMDMEMTSGEGSSDEM